MYSYSRVYIWIFQYAFVNHIKCACFFFIRLKNKLYIAVYIFFMS